MPKRRKASPCGPQTVLLGTQRVEDMLAFDSDSGTAAQLPNPAPYSRQNVNHPKQHFSTLSQIINLSHYHVGWLHIFYVSLQKTNSFLFTSLTPAFLLFLLPSLLCAGVVLLMVW